MTAGGAGPVRLLIESEWGCYPFFIDEGDGIFRHIDPEVVQEMFDVPHDVMKLVEYWDELFHSVLDWADPSGWDWPSVERRDAYVQRGREVMRVFRQHIPSRVSIEYRADGSLAPEFY